MGLLSDSAGGGEFGGRWGRGGKHRYNTRVLSKKSVVALGAVSAVLGCGFLADTALATRAEAQLSRTIAADAELTQVPSVFIGGGPLFLLGVLKGEVPTVAASINDATSNRYGLVSTQVEFKDVTMSAQDILAGNVDGANAKLMSSLVRLDPVAVGELLHIPDLDISNPHNISPAGVPSSEVQLRGTIDGQEEPVTVRADLRLNGPTFRMTPTLVLDNPTTLSEEAIYQAFDLSFDTNTLPLGSQADYVAVSGGVILFSATKRDVVVEISEFTQFD
nr:MULTISPECIES: DUF2993 domain-containing protein [unclassified Corynebacterium]